MRHKLFLLISGITLTFSCFAQFNIKNQKTMGGDREELLSAIVLTNDGGMLVGGGSYSGISGERTDSSRGEYDYWIVKFDGVGKKQWDKAFGGNGTDYLSSLQQTYDGGYILGGWSGSDISGDKLDTCRGWADYWVIKINEMGNTEWQKTIGGTTTDILYSIQQTNDGGYILGGYSDSYYSGEKTDSSRGFDDYWIIKLYANGEIQWKKTIGGNNSDDLSSIQQTLDGGYIVGGFSYSNISGEKTENNRGDLDYWIVKLDSYGNILWDKTIGGAGRDVLETIVQINDGSYIIGGWSDSNISGEKSENSKGYEDYWVVKLNAAGKIQWDKTIGGSSTDYLYSIQQTSDGNFVLGGYSFSDSSWDKTEKSRGGFDYWIVKLSNNRKIQWDKTIGGNMGDALVSIKEKEKNFYVLGGYSFSGISGEKSQKLRGVCDYWVIGLKYDHAKFIVSEQEANTLVDEKPTTSVYPNPARNILHINSKTKATYTLTNQSGVTILTQMVIGKGEMNVSQLKAGVYYLKNNSTGGVQKIAIQ